MGLFSRRTKEGPEDGQRATIAGFWRWWLEEGRDLATGATGDSGTRERFVAEMARAVDCLHPDLGWETAPGRDSAHLLTVTAAGIPELRPIARRWRMAAPPGDEIWTYSDVRLPIAGDLTVQRLEVDGRSYDVSLATVDARVRGVSLDVTVHHPEYPAVSEQERQMVTYLMLDQVLGEEAVETWLGTIESSELPALDPVPIAGLRSVVESLRGASFGADGTANYAMLQGVGPTGSPVVVLARLPLRPATAPHLDTYVGVVVPYADRTESGLPGPGSLDALRALEDHVAQLLGPSGEVLAVESHEGRRILHVYVDGLTPAAEQVRVAVSGWDQGQVQMQVLPDPAWSAVAHLRT